ncbi:MAG TPA: SDR family NAD(P)-dependent oxidoreductase [Accumulibacter sp.]|nr:SDR family NAD(P)-dependent oxidoreductase [Accumulibacter sp.]
MYTGNGSQWAGMGRRLLAGEPVFSAAVREVDALFQRHADYSIEDELAGSQDEAPYERTEIAQPALFAVQVGITRLLAQRGIKPQAVAGHSVGEVAAAWASGALTLPQAVEVIYHRSRLQGMTRGQGQMTAIALDHQAARQLIEDLGLETVLEIAGVNSSRGVTVAGDAEQLGILESALARADFFHKRLALDYAFHSPAMDGIEGPLKTALAELQAGAAVHPFYSTVTGETVDGRQLNAEYWWQNIRQPVLFEAAVKAMVDDGINVFVEIGPSPILRSYLNDCLKDRATDGRVVATLLRDDDSPERIWSAACQTVIAGATHDWQIFFPRPARFVQLPNYPWQRERHWHPVSSESAGLLYRHKRHPLLGYALAQHELTWENQLDTLHDPILADHVVGEATVFPGAGFAELALAAALAWQADGVAAIDDLEIRSPLLIEDERSTVIRSTIAAQDGSLTISSREQLGSEPWTLHTTARVRCEADGALLREDASALPDREPDFDASSHAALTRSVGIKYGPAFQCIEHGWVQGNSVLAVYRIPDSIDRQIEHAYVHPALLDCAFQLVFQLLKDAIDGNQGIAFVPVRMGRIVFRNGLARPAYARATLLRQGSRSLRAEFALFTADGSAIAVVNDVLFRSVRLSRNAADQLRCLAYHATPLPHALMPAGEPGIAFDRVRWALADLTRRAALKGTHRRYSEEVDPLLDTLCSRFTRLALLELSADGRSLPSRAIIACQTACPATEAFLASLLSLAEDDQSLAVTADGWEIVPDSRDQSSAQDIWNSLVADDPDYFQIVHSVGRIGMHLGRLLAGGATLSEICPQESSLATLLRQVLGSSGKQKIGQAVRELIGRGLRDLPEGRRLRIVEISAGAPLFAMDVCSAMDFNRGDYCFASTSASVLDEVLGHLKECSPEVDTQLIGEPPWQGSAGSASSTGGALAIVVLDFDTLETTLQALDHARSCLAVGGSLVVIGQHPSRWIDFVFGARQEGWSRQEGGSWLSGQRPSFFWQQQLKESGFASCELFEFSPDTLSGPYLLLGKLNETDSAPAAEPRSTLRSWVLLADQAGFSAQLSDQLTKKLQARGDLVIQSSASSSVQIASLLGEMSRNYGELDGIVHLAGLIAEPGDATADDMLDRQVGRCATAASIFRACAETRTTSTCWLITANAVSHLLPGRAAAATPEMASIAADTALWGFGRTMLNEADNCAIRLIDLETPLAIETAAAALDREFEQADAEQEVMLTASGERYALRLRIEERPNTQQQAPIQTPTVALGFQFPGQLRNLRWEAQPRRDLAADQIEVDVQATGLNFRDVMYALGLLADEAIENGFAGPTLGFEFAGTVSRSGREGSGFSPGDQVVGFGPSSFGNRVVTQTTAIAQIPPGISFEAAATIPSTFFTVYYAMHHLARLQPGEKVLIHGAAGGVGIAAVQVAKWIGAEIYASAGSDEKRDFLRLLGVDHIFDSRSLAFADQIMAQTDGQGVDVVLNSLAGEAINRNFQVLKPFGRFLELGKRDFYENTKIGLRPFRNNISYFGIDADQLMLVRPELTRSLFGEIMDLFADGVFHPLPYRSFEADDIVDAFRFMQQARQIGKIVITYRHGINRVHSPEPPKRRPLLLAADASYLITGGLQGFGLRTAQWLASKGARQLILISRSGPASDEALQAIAGLEEQGVQVYAAACDVTNREALAALLAETARTLPPLKGIVHAATVIDDGLVRNLDADQIRRVLAPKVVGARYLHELTGDRELDLFILFSSATTVFGNPGQASYVAANACLEALAEYRRSIGLCATCVGWGPIDDVGFLARNIPIKEALVSRMGGAALQSAIALDALEEMLLANRSGLAVLDFDWNALSRLLPSAASPKFRELAWHADDGDDQDNHSEDIQRLLTELSDEDLLAAFIDILRGEISEILRVAPDKIDANRSLYDMGLDSLMGVELMVALEGRFGIRLPVMALSQSPTIARLAAKVIQQLRGTDEGSESDERHATIAQQVAQIAEQQGAVSRDLIDKVTEDLQSRSAATTPQAVD